MFRNENNQKRLNFIVSIIYFLIFHNGLIYKLKYVTLTMLMTQNYIQKPIIYLDLNDYSSTVIHKLYSTLNSISFISLLCSDFTYQYFIKITLVLQDNTNVKQVNPQLQVRDNRIRIQRKPIIKNKRRVQIIHYIMFGINNMLMKLYFPFYVLTYFQSQYFNLASVLIIFIITGVVVLFKLIIDNFPNWINIILPILQILFALIWSADNLQSEQYITKYSWFYGFQSFYFHYAIMQQGYQILPQTLSLLGLYVYFLILFANDTLEFIALSLTQISVIIGLIFLKYTNLKLKRSQFIDHRERNKWIKIIEQIVDYQLIVVQFDKRQDQIIMKQINDETKEKFQIKDNQDLRKILRDVQIFLQLQMQIITSGTSQSKPRKESLEKAIRDQFCHNYQQLVPSYDVISNILKQEFRVKLIQYILQEVQCVILAFDCQSRQEIKSTLLNQKLSENIFLQYSSNVLSSICNYHNKLGILQQIVNLQFYRIWVDNKRLITQKTQIKLPSLISQLQNTLQRKIKLKQSFEFNDSFSLNFNALQMVLVGLTQFVDHNFQVAIKLNNQILFNHLTFKIETKKTLVPIQTCSLIQRMLDFDDNNWIKNKQKITECIKILSDKKQSNQDVFLFPFIMCSYFLNSSFNQSKLRFSRKKDQRQKVTFEIII
ncbi:unnamed protein product (macronuclear) [Paramecium tetraurelia]|uniref:Transmembrane protein n=1 Tax=Paramecium tetraurelia TaxID=5888 RepID=A0DQ34_PARTE|nr:uncharacterized protein GSPATT00002551001 [Paramecium tetraurelia]CAK85151.1 unnamed protein product [Paramecium tetraurelia]|eukprot:XP_001452548.1 hypothetical protein (macronuclear) [Paramecium tetraurelia strain d4-2]